MTTTLAVIEKIKETNGKVPEHQILTAQYLRQLNSSGSSTMKYLGRRYKG